MRAKEFTFKDFVALLRRNRYYLKRCTGDHYIYTNGVNTISINQKPNRMVCRRLIKENHLS